MNAFCNRASMAPHSFNLSEKRGTVSRLVRHAVVGLSEQWKQPSVQVGLQNEALARLCGDLACHKLL